MMLEELYVILFGHNFAGHKPHFIESFEYTTCKFVYCAPLNDQYLAACRTIYTFLHIFKSISALRRIG